MEVTETQIRDYIECNLRQKVQADGGEIRFLSLNGSTVRLRLQGECSICPVAGKCKDWLEEQLEKRFESAFNIEFEVVKPYFWRR